LVDVIAVHRGMVNNVMRKDEATRL
jgi:hypothetical protein